MSGDRKAWLAQIEDGAMQAKVSTTDRVVAYYRQAREQIDSHALQIAAKQNDDANCWINALLLRIKALEAELNMQRADEPVAMSDPPQSAQPHDDTPHRSVVDQTIDALDKRLVSRSDRIRLRGSLDAADAPPAGRAGADEALGRVTRWQEPKRWGEW